MARNAGTILVIEDDPAMRRLLSVTLQTQDYRIVEAISAHEALRQAASDPPDVVILDLGLPDMDGVEVTRRLREWTRSPIIVVSARGREHDKVVALDAGADDYLTKPFGVGELLARVRAAIRRAASRDTGSGEPSYSIGGLVIDLARRRVSVNGRAVHLTPHEFGLLSVLARHAGKVLTHGQLLKEVWGPDAMAETHYVRVCMNQLRQKIEPDSSRPVYLLTETGVGYRLAAE